MQYPAHFLLFPRSEMGGVSPRFANRIAKKPSHKKGTHPMNVLSNIPNVYSTPKPVE